MPGALAGLRIIEFAGLGPAPFCAMMLADHGAEVIRIERPGGSNLLPGDPQRDPLLRSRQIRTFDLKSSRDLAEVTALVREADGLIEGFRPGVMERLGLGPEQMLAANPRLVYGRMTGWGQTGRYAQAAGHDINYIALSGALHALGRAGEPPTPPANLLGDFGGGGMLLAFGMLAGILNARETGVGQVIDCAMTDGSALLMAMMCGLSQQGYWTDVRGTNLLDTGAYFYDVYECADGRFLAVGALEPQFYAALIRGLGPSAAELAGSQPDAERWPVAKGQVAAIFRTRSRDEWCAHFENTDACVAPVLSLAEAARHPHNVERGTYAEVEGDIQPAPAPRFSRTPPVPPSRPRR